MRTSAETFCGVLCQQTELSDCRCRAASSHSLGSVESIHCLLDAGHAVGRSSAPSSNMSSSSSAIKLSVVSGAPLLATGGGGFWDPTNLDDKPRISNDNPDIAATARRRLQVVQLRFSFDVIFLQLLRITHTMI